MLTVEDGTGIEGAESYASVAAADAYWAKLSHLTLATTWAAFDTAGKEGRLREAPARLMPFMAPYIPESERGAYRVFYFHE